MYDPNPVTTEATRVVLVKFEWRALPSDPSVPVLYCGGYRKGHIDFAEAYGQFAEQSPFCDRWYVWQKRTTHVRLVRAFCAANGGSLEAAKDALVDAVIQELGKPVEDFANAE